LDFRDFLKKKVKNKKARSGLESEIDVILENMKQTYTSKAALMKGYQKTHQNPSF
jgi:hypothetical protein